MDQGLTTAWIGVLAAAVAVALAAAGLVASRRAARRRRALEQELAASREELLAVRSRLDELDRALAPAAPEATGRHRADAADRTADDAGLPDYVITTAGLPQVPAPGAAAAPVSAGRFASLAVGESVVRLVSLGYGVRRALAPESRNRIRFEMGRQVRRSRKERKRELRQARRFLRSSQGGLASEDRVDAA